MLPRIELTNGSEPYEPMARLHSRRRPVSNADPMEWKKHLGFAPDHVVAKTLSATTQLIPTVEAETGEIMRDHFQTRLPELKVRRVNEDVCYVDTFFPLSLRFEVTHAGICFASGAQGWILFI